MKRIVERCAALVLLGVTFVPASSRAEPARIFRLPAESLDAALVRFAIQGGVSVGGWPVNGCSGSSRAVAGVFTPSGALHRLLPSGCSFARVDARAFRITAAPRQPVPVGAAAEATPHSAVTNVAELVVTAEKRPEPLRGSPFAVTAFSGAEIERLGAKNLSDLAFQTPGVTETNLGPGRDKIFIRGISDGAFTGRTQSTVGLYLNEVPITYNAPDPDLRLADVERVEVLRGPQGTLYGSGSIGGILRIVTARPDTQTFASRVVAEATINQHQDHSLGGELMLNAPLLNGAAAARGVVYVDELAGYLDNPRLRLEDVNRGHRSGQRLSGLINLPGDWQFEAGLVRQSIQMSDSQYVPGRGRLGRDTRIQEPHDNDFTLIETSLAHTGSTADVHLSIGFIDHDLATRYDATGAFDLAADQVAAFDEDQRVSLLVGEAIATSATEGRLRWLAGAFASRSRETSGAQLDATLSGGVVRSAFQRRDHLTEAAIFGELDYELTSRLTATLGGRLFLTKVATDAGDFGLARSSLARVQGRDTDSGFAPKLRLSYTVSPDLVFYAQAQDGYRAGGFNVPAEADGMAGGPQVAAYKPDRLRSYEVGGEATLFTRSVTVRLAAYRANWRAVQTDQFRASGLPLTLNIGDGSNSGVEFEALWRPDSHLRLRLTGLMNDPELIRTNPLFPARADVGLPGVAKGSGSLDIGYQWGLSADLKAEISAQASYVGRSFLTFDGASTSVMGNYAQARLSAAVTARNWQVQAFVANLLNESGDTFAFGNPFSRARARQTTPLPPRSLGLAIRRSF